MRLPVRRAWASTVRSPAGDFKTENADLSAASPFRLRLRLRKSTTASPPESKTLSEPCHCQSARRRVCVSCVSHAKTFTDPDSIGNTYMSCRTSPSF